MAFTNHHQAKSAVNHSPIASSGLNRIKNRVHRQCAKDGFDARIRAKIAAKQPNDVAAVAPLYSHHSTRQSYFNLGWQAVTPTHVLRAKARNNSNDKG
jgi:hypothetical protein